jgi:hypothetical protein
MIAETDIYGDGGLPKFALADHDEMGHDAIYEFNELVDTEDEPELTWEEENQFEEWKDKSEEMCPAKPGEYMVTEDLEIVSHIDRRLVITKRSFIFIPKPLDKLNKKETFELNKRHGERRSKTHNYWGHAHECRCYACAQRCTPATSSILHPRLTVKY